MKLERIREMLKVQNPCIFEGKCIDCRSTVVVTATQDGEDITINGGAVFQPPADWHSPTEYLFKCDVCYAKNPTFNPRTEVYSRCVGYLRAKNQFNPGKLAEVESRKMFDINSI